MASSTAYREEEEQGTYQPQNALGLSMKSAAYFGGLGFFVSAVQNSLARTNVGAMGVFWKTGGSIGLFSAVGGSYTFASLAAANLRERNDNYNTAIGGAVSGAIAGSLRGRSFPALLGYGAIFSVAMSAYSYTGAVISGREKNVDEDEFDRKENMRKNRRRPITETFEQLGEGRGITGPGYQERRADRLKERYGIDVRPSPSRAA